MKLGPPKHWDEMRFGNLVSHSAFGPRFSSEDYASDGNVAALRTTDIDNHGRISYDSMPRALLDEDGFSNHFLKLGDLVITRSGTCGIAAVFDGFSVPVLPGAFLIRFRLNDFADPVFFRYYFNSPKGRANILSVARGAVQQNLNLTNVENLLVPLPSIRDQQEIVKTLSAYDDAIENNRRRMELLERAARLLYEDWFVRLRFPGHETTPITNGIPEGWERLPFEEALVLQRGFDLPENDRTEGEFPICGSTGIIGYHHEARAKGPGVFTGRSGSLGVVNYIAGDYWPHNTSLWVKEFKKVTPKFALYLLREMNLKQYNGGSSVPTLDRKAVHRVLIVVPSGRILALFDKQLEPIFSQLQNLTKQNQKLRTARDLLLPKLMSGNIAV